MPRSPSSPTSRRPISACRNPAPTNRTITGTEPMLRLLIVWLINAVALLTVAYLMPSIVVANFTTALVAAVVLGLVNAVIRPILILLTLPATLLTLGLFIFVINGLLFWLAGSFIE